MRAIHSSVLINFLRFGSWKTVEAWSEKKNSVLEEGFSVGRALIKEFRVFLYPIKHPSKNLMTFVTWVTSQHYLILAVTNGLILKMWWYLCSIILQLYHFTKYNFFKLNFHISNIFNSNLLSEVPMYIFLIKIQWNKKRGKFIHQIMWLW